MNILSLDTTAKTASVSLCEVLGNNEVAIKSIATVNNTLTHSESLLPMIEFCLDQTKLKVQDIDLVATSVGPGSFTGVRIGISTVKGLCFEDDIPVAPVSSVEALCHNVSDIEAEGTVVCPCMDARRNQFYNALFEITKDGINRLCNDRAIGADELFREFEEKYKDKKIVLVGDGAVLCEKLFKEANCKADVHLSRNDRLLQNAYSVALVGKKVYDEGKCQSASQILPVYLRMSQAEREKLERESK